MNSSNKSRTIGNPEIIYRNKKPVSVILDIEEYEKLLEKLEDCEDAAYINNLRNGSLTFRKFDKFLKETKLF